MKGSTVAAETTPSFAWKEKRKSLIQEYTTIKNGKLVLNSDKTFNSPSTAASFCIGRSCNGWTIWTDDNGQTLDSVYRKQLE